MVLAMTGRAARWLRRPSLRARWGPHGRWCVEAAALEGCPPDQPALCGGTGIGAGAEHVALTVLTHQGVEVPQPGAETGELSDAHSRKVRHGWAQHRRSAKVGLDLHEQVTGTAAAIGEEALELAVGALGEGVQDVGDLVRDRFDRGPGQL